MNQTITWKKHLKICLLFLLLVSVQLKADPLPSWNNGPTKNSLIQFVREATEKGHPHFIPIEERIAAFDEDGTLWVEQPLYTQFFFALETLKSLAAQHPKWENQEPFKSILSGNKEVIQNLTLPEMEQILVVTHTGMTVEAFHKQFKKPFTELVYQPMLELIQFLRSHQFEIYIVSGGGQEFMRAFAQKVYGIPPSHVIGTAGKVKYDYQNGRPVLVKTPELLFVDDKEGKPEGINLVIGQRPVAAFGNSIGDQQMLEWTQAGSRKSLQVLIHHDDAQREYAYGPESKIGTFSDALMAKQRGWIVVSIKKDWNRIFSWQSKSDDSSPPKLR
jgi:phosphoglycolate phosphatase-like HAD superfamily hydrolase